MEYIIGINRKDMALRPLVENRLPLQSVLGGCIQIKKEADNYIWMELYGPAQTLAMANILADIIVETLQIKFLMREIVVCYGVDSEREQCELLIETVKRLWKQEGKHGLEKQKEEIGRRIAKCLLEEGRFLSLDGVMHFRMQDYLACWREMLDQVVQEKILHKEQKEFIQLLRYLVGMKDPGTEYVSAMLQGEEYVLKDWQNRQIVLEDYLWEEDSTKEDRLISRLIALSPEVICLDEVQDEMLVQLIREIFVGRVRRSASKFKT